jgi:hypothetical protein
MMSLTEGSLFALLKKPSLAGMEFLSTSLQFLMKGTEGMILSYFLRAQGELL